MITSVPCLATPQNAQTAQQPTAQQQLYQLFKAKLQQRQLQPPRHAQLFASRDSPKKGRKRRSASSDTSLGASALSKSAPNGPQSSLKQNRCDRCSNVIPQENFGLHGYKRTRSSVELAGCNFFSSSSSSSSLSSPSMSPASSECLAPSLSPAATPPASTAFRRPNLPSAGKTTDSPSEKVSKNSDLSLTKLPLLPVSPGPSRDRNYSNFSSSSASSSLFELEEKEEASDNSDRDIDDSYGSDSDNTVFSPDSDSDSGYETTMNKSRKTSCNSTAGARSSGVADTSGSLGSFATGLSSGIFSSLGAEVHSARFDSLSPTNIKVEHRSPPLAVFFRRSQSAEQYREHGFPASSHSVQNGVQHASTKQQNIASSFPTFMESFRPPLKVKVPPRPIAIATAKLNATGTSICGSTHSSRATHATHVAHTSHIKASNLTLLLSKQQHEQQQLQQQCNPTLLPQTAANYTQSVTSTTRSNFCPPFTKSSSYLSTFSSLEANAGHAQDTLNALSSSLTNSLSSAAASACSQCVSAYCQCEKYGVMLLDPPQHDHGNVPMFYTQSVDIASPNVGNLTQNLLEISATGATTCIAGDTDSEARCTVGNTRATTCSDGPVCTVDHGNDGGEGSRSRMYGIFLNFQKMVPKIPDYLTSSSSGYLPPSSICLSLIKQFSPTSAPTLSSSLDTDVEHSSSTCPSAEHATAHGADTVSFETPTDGTHDSLNEITFEGNETEPASIYTATTQRRSDGQSNSVGHTQCRDFWLAYVSSAFSGMSIAKPAYLQFA